MFDKLILMYMIYRTLSISYIFDYHDLQCIWKKFSQNFYKYIYIIYFRQNESIGHNNKLPDLCSSHLGRFGGMYACKGSDRLCMTYNYQLQARYNSHTVPCKLDTLNSPFLQTYSLDNYSTHGLKIQHPTFHSPYLTHILIQHGMWYNSFHLTPSLKV